MAVMLDGETVFSAGAGLANLEYDVPITPATVFHSASLAKQFTAFAVLLLVVEERVALEDDIRRYVPELQDTGEVVTIRHLLDHMSGLRDQWTLLGMAGWRGDDVKTDDQIVALLSRQRGFNFAPGEQYQYSNSGYTLLARMVERVSSQSFSSFTRERIFTPLGMASTHFHDDRSQLIPNRAYSYSAVGEHYTKLGLNFATVGPTGLQTTVEDLLKWARNFETRVVGSAAVFRLMRQRSVAADGTPAVFARGQEYRVYNGLQTWSHGGRDAGYRAFLLRIPDEQFAVAVLSNRADTDAARIAFAVADHYLGQRAAYKNPQPTPWQPATAAELAAYQGVYEIFPGLLFAITAEAGKLYFAPLQGGQAVAMPQVGQGRFMLNPQADIAIEFPSAEQGAVESFSYVIGLNGALTAQRVSLQPFDPEGVEAAEYTGVYFSDELMIVYDLRVENGQLMAVHARLPPIALTPYQADVFSGDSANFQKIEFMRDASGRVSACRVSGALVNDVVFQRLE
ncbi:MAG: hypothetical protein Tsb002_14800 [Wenzhouxiangellaceae bacterium]